MSEPTTPRPEEKAESVEDIAHEAQTFAEREPAENGTPESTDHSWSHQEPGDAGPKARDTWATDIRGSNGIIVGDNATMVVVDLADGGETTALRYHRTVGSVREAAERFVEVPGFWETVKELKKSRIRYVCAEPGSGRRFLSERMLAELAGEDRVYGLHLPTPGVSLVDLARQKDLMVHGAGMVLELAEPGPVTAALLDTFAGLAEEAQGWLVILGSQPGGPGTSEYEYRPESPDPRAVLRRHIRANRPDLVDLIDACLAEETDRDQLDADPEPASVADIIRDQLNADPRPAAVADLARALADWDGTEATLGEALGGLRARVRQLASELVNRVTPEDSADPQTAPRRQAVQIAYATFAGHPLADVFEVVQPLFQFLWIEENGEATPSRVLFDGGVEKIMSADGKSSLLDGDLTRYPRRVRFRDARLPMDIVDVIWNDFDGVRRPFRLWLGFLVEKGRDGIRRRAASVAGLLLMLDFNEVWRELVGPWAHSGRAVHREAAAWAVDTAAENDQLLWMLRGRVRDWVRSNNAQLHDTAARAYGTRFGAASLAEALADLRVLAGRDDLNHSASVARAMQYLYLEAPAEVRARLSDWMADDLYRVQVHAARSLILIAALSAEAPRQQWPRLLADLADIDDPGALAEPWRAALAGPTTSLRAWKTLHLWLRRADNDESLRDVLLHLGRQVLAEPLTRRGRFYLAQWSQDSDTARRLSAEL